MSPSIGILGGVGAIASARFHLDLVEEWAKVHSAKTDDDFPRIIHVSHSLGLGAAGVIDRDETSITALAALWPLFECERIAVVCNSVTDLLPQAGPLAPKLLTPVGACREALRGVSRAWLLASDSTIRDQIYQRAYPYIDWKVPTQSLTPVIQRAIANSHTYDLAMAIPDEDTVVLGCTELSTQAFVHPKAISPTDEMIKILCS